jgi:hypothetical protein
VEWIAAVVVAGCLVVLIVDFSRRGCPPRVYIDVRSPVTWSVIAVVVAVVVGINVLD